MYNSNWYKHCVWLVKNDKDIRADYIQCLINPKHRLTLELIHPARLLIDSGIRVDVSLYLTNYRFLTRTMREL